MSKIQNEDIKSVADLTGAGGTASQLPNDDKIYVTGGSINKTLKQAIIDGDVLTGSPLPATKGGTGQTTITTGDLLYGSASNVISKRAIGSSGQVLSVSGGVPTWTTSSGGIVAVGTATPSGASNTTISSLNGNTDKVWRIKIRGVWSGANNIVMFFRPNADATSTNYYGLRYSYYSGGIVSTTWSATTEALLIEKIWANDNVVEIDILFSCDTTGNARTIKATGSYITPAQPDGGYHFSGGGWKDTTNNVTSLYFDYGGGTFTGTINVYPELP